MKTKIMKCPSLCKSVYQDQRYGEGYRIHNETKQSKPKKEDRGWRCTVCGIPKGLSNKVSFGKLKNHNKSGLGKPTKPKVKAKYR